MKYDLYNPIIKTIRCVCYFYRYIKKNKLSKFKTRLLKWEKISLCSYLLSYWKILGLLWNKHTLWNMRTFTFIWILPLFKMCLLLLLNLILKAINCLEIKLFEWYQPNPITDSYNILRNTPLAKTESVILLFLF